jgi:hypothetical protein
MSRLNLKEYPRKGYSIDQFTQPHCTELMGRSFHFVMDGGVDFYLKFTGKTTVEWNAEGEEPKTAVYECLKGDDTTYLLDYDLTETLGQLDKRVNHFFIIDLEQRLVTKAVCTMGYNPRFPFLVKSEYEFGAIETEGCELPLKRHCFTGEMLGTRVEWHWNTEMITQHSYYSPAFYRITWPKSSSAVEKIGDPFELLPASDEIAQYIKIKDKMYLFSLTEEIMERIVGDKCQFRSNNMNFLQNYDRMYHVGRTFGTVKRNDELVPCRTLFGAFGNPVKLDDDFLNADNPFTV